MSDVSDVVEEIPAEERPVFDFSEVSYGWSKEYNRVVFKIEADGALIESNVRDGVDPEDAAALRAAKLEAMAGWDDLISERDRLMVMPLVSVPRTWLVKDAPGDITWDGAECLEWLRGNRIGDLVAALGEARVNAQKK